MPLPTRDARSAGWPRRASRAGAGARAGGRRAARRASASPTRRTRRSARVWLRALATPRDAARRSRCRARIDAAPREDAQGIAWPPRSTGCSPGAPTSRASRAGGTPARNRRLRRCARGARAARWRASRSFAIIARCCDQRALLAHPLQPRLVAEALLIDYRALFGYRWPTRCRHTLDPATVARPGVLSLNIREKAALYAAYMPFLKGGGIFIPDVAPVRARRGSVHAAVADGRSEPHRRAGQGRVDHARRRAGQSHAGHRRAVHLHLEDRDLRVRAGPRPSRHARPGSGPGRVGPDGRLPDGRRVAGHPKADPALRPGLRAGQVPPARGWGQRLRGGLRLHRTLRAPGLRAGQRLPRRAEAHRSRRASASSRPARRSATWPTSATSPR